MTAALQIIVPAHNEGEYIADCLHSILAQDYAGPLCAIVVANGCSDDTAARARAHQSDFAAKGWALKVADLAQGGKPGALNHGDGLGGEGVRLYLDADIRLGPGLLAGLAQALDSDQPRYAGGKLVVAPGDSVISTAYARFWQRLPFNTRDVTGAGLFAVNPAGRARWGEFPNIISDDTYARLQFAPAERVLVDIPYLWPIAQGFRRLVRVRRRQDEGVAEIARLFPELLSNQGHTRPDKGEILRLAARAPLGFLVYAAVALAVRAGRNQQDWARGR